MKRSDKEGRTINAWRWLADSSGVAFLEGGGDFGEKRLVLGDLQKKAIEPLTLTSEQVKDFDIRDRQHYVYITADRAEHEATKAERQAPAMIGTGRSLFELLIPDDPLTLQSFSHHTSRLWAVVAGKRFEVKAHGMPVVPAGDLALSPDGQVLATELEIPTAPESWETLYPPSFTSSPYRIRPGQRAHQYFRIHLQTGSIQPLTEAPVGTDAGWWAAYGSASLDSHVS